MKETRKNRNNAFAYCNRFSALSAAWAFSTPPTFSMSALAAIRASRFNDPPQLLVCSTLGTGPRIPPLAPAVKSGRDQSFADQCARHRNSLFLQSGNDVAWSNWFGKSPSGLPDHFGTTGLFCLRSGGFLGSGHGITSERRRGCKQVILIRRPVMYRDPDLPTRTRLPSGFERRRMGEE